MRKRTFKEVITEHDKQIAWQRQVIREEAIEKINKQKKNGKYVSHS